MRFSQKLWAWRGDFPMKFCGLCYVGSKTLWVLMVTESFKDISACLQDTLREFHWAGNYNLHPSRWITSIGFTFAWAKPKTWAPDSCLRMEPVWVCSDISNNIFVWFSPWAQPETYWFGKMSQSKWPSLGVFHKYQYDTQKQEFACLEEHGHHKGSLSKVAFYLFRALKLCFTRL